MTNSKSKPKKQETTSEWKSEIIERWTPKGTKTVWVSQKLTAPDGKRMLSIRKLALKADGTEIYTSSGITLPDGPESAATLKKLSGMLRRMFDGLEHGADVK